MSGQIRVGIVGANPSRGWAQTAHLPALAGLDGFEISAVSTTRLESARETAESLGARYFFDNAEALASCDEVDLVVVSVRVPFHHEIVETAISAGKHVFCEWPLGATSAEATDLVDKADAAGVRHVIGLQGRKSPTLNYVRHLVADGYLGRFRTATLSLVTSGRGGPTIAPDRAWTADKRAGVTLLSIIGGHNLDSVRYCLGEYAQVSANVVTLDPVTTVLGTEEKITVTAPDHVLIQGSFASGALFAAEFLSAARPYGVRLAIYGESGALFVEGGGSLHIGDADLVLAGAQGADAPERLSVPASFDTVPASIPVGPGRNVAGLYLAFREGLEAGTPIDPDFRTALSMHQALDAIEDSSERRAVAVL